MTECSPDGSGRRRHTRRIDVPLTVVSVLLAGAVLPGCGRQRDDDAYTVVNSSTGESYHRRDGDTLACCGKRPGVTIEQQSVPAPQLMTKAPRMASSKSLPDVLQLDASEMPTFAEAGGLIPLKELGLTTKDIPEGILGFGSFDGTYYGAARTVNTLALFHDEDILDRAGLRVPTTWAEMRSKARKLTQGKRYGLALSAGGAEDGVFQFTPFMGSNGGDETKLDSAEVAGALDYWNSKKGRAVRAARQQDDRLRHAHHPDGAGHRHGERPVQRVRGPR